MRVLDLAKELKISANALKKHLQDLGINVKSHLNIIDEDIVNKIRQKYNEEKDSVRQKELEKRKFLQQKRVVKAVPKEQSEQRQDLKTSKYTYSRDDVNKTGEKQQIKDPFLPQKSEKTKSPTIANTKENIPVKSDDREAIKSKKDTQTTIKTTDKPVQKKSVETKIGEKDQIKTDTKVERVRADYRKPKTEKYHDLNFREKVIKKTPSYQKTTPIHSPKKIDISLPKAEFPPKPLPEIKDKYVKKAKTDVDELGPKSKHLKAKLKNTKKTRKKKVEPIEIDEAAIAKNIKKTLAQTDKKKKHKKEEKTTDISSLSEKKIEVSEFTSVSELAKIMNIQPNEIIGRFFKMGQMLTINQRLDKDSLEMVCEEFNLDVSFKDEYGSELIEKEIVNTSDAKQFTRPPIVTVMGHVDHGKTSILDYIRSTNIIAGESGGITQHIGAYQVTHNKKKITFLDTPGHEAFAAMRARGANITDFAIIVVAANDGVMPQTIEAIDHAKSAGVELIVAINKIDLPSANIDKVISELGKQNIFLENYGGEVLWVKCSALTGSGINELLDTIVLASEMKELKAKKNVPAKAIVLESKKDHRMGSVITILVTEGILRKGDNIICGATHGKVRKMENERNQEIKEIGASDVAIIYGLNDVPQAGDYLNKVKNEKIAKQISSERALVRKEREKFQSKTNLDNLFDRIKERTMTELKIVLKADTDGSVEALCDSLEKLSNDEVSVNIIRKSVGGITEADINLANASDAIIIGFQVRVDSKAKRIAEEEKVEIKLYNVIYDTINDIKLALSGLLSPDISEEYLGNAVVKKVFKIKEVGFIAGCAVEKGRIRNDSLLRLYRNDIKIYEGEVSSLKHFNDEVKEVKAGFECGIGIKNCNDIKEGDVIEAYTKVEKARTL